MPAQPTMLECQPDLFGGIGHDPTLERNSALAQRFIVPPFSVLDARSGAWQRRKRAWIGLGIKGELGRGPNAPGLSDGCVAYRTGTGDYGKTFNSGGPGTLAAGFRLATDNRSIGDHAWQATHGKKTMSGRHTPDAIGMDGPPASGTSIFDPVLCELVYQWFCPTGGHILDPFAGEATKGIVAAYAGYQYTGIEVRPDQVAANMAQAADIGVNPTWIIGDSAGLTDYLPDGARYDLVFTSPPYYNLEVYSADSRDGSTKQTYAEFMEWYRVIFAGAVDRLADNRFVVVKVGEIRDGRGIYRNFVGDNIACFMDLGLAYYNEAILVTAAGSLPIRVSGQFDGGRKLGKTHQNILVFYKGDPRQIKQHFTGVDGDA